MPKMQRGSQEPGRIGDDGHHASTVLIVSTIRFLREGLAEALGGNSLLEVSGLSSNLDEALISMRELKPAIVLLDANFPNGAGAVRVFRAVDPVPRVVVFAVAETEENIITWAEAGAAGYIPNTAALDDLFQLLVDIMQGKQICSGRVAAGLIRRLAGAAKSGDGLRGLQSPLALTARELEIIRLVSSGLSNKEIARKLNIELSTAKSHVHNVLGKLNLQRRGQVAFWARDSEGLRF
jgi:DNA-binding NarL/FixJ family response regulator